MNYRFIVSHLTNHERNLWARAGYPGLQKKGWQTEDERCALVKPFLKHEVSQP